MFQLGGFLKKGNGKIITVIYIFLIGVFACIMTLSCTNNSETSEGLSVTAETNNLNYVLANMANNNSSDNDLGETGSGESDGEDLLNEAVDENIIDDSSDALVEEEAEEEATGEEDVEEQGQANGEEIQNEENSSGQNGDEEIDFSNKDYFRIAVDLSLQKVFIFYKDRLIKEMICSGGTEEKPTPIGEFETYEKIEYSWVPKYNMGAYYWVRFYYDYLFHSVPFDENNEMIMEEYEKLGTPASHGCIRLKLEEAKWLYEMLPLGVKVMIY